MRIGPRIVIALAIAMTASAICAQPVSPPVLAQMRVISWNLHGVPLTKQRRSRMSAAAKEIASRDADIVALQEVWSSADARVIAGILDPLGYERADFRAYWPWRRSGLLVFVSRARGWHVIGTKSTYFHASGPWWKVLQADGLSGKGFLRVDVRSVPSGRIVSVIATHLQSQYAHNQYVDVRRRQARQLVESTLAIPQNVPIIIAGDFNTTPDGTYDKTIYDLLAAAWTDTTTDARRSCESQYGTHFDHGKLTNEWIDYVFVRNLPLSSKPAASRIMNRGEDDPFSDHEGIDVVLDRPGDR